jgi:hypothetical protein
VSRRNPPASISAVGPPISVMVHPLMTVEPDQRGGVAFYAPGRAAFAFRSKAWILPPLTMAWPISSRPPEAVAAYILLVFSSRGPRRSRKHLFRHPEVLGARRRASKDDGPSANHPSSLPGLTRWSTPKCSARSNAARLNEPDTRMDGGVKPGHDDKQNRSRDAVFCSHPSYEHGTAKNDAAKNKNPIFVRSIRLWRAGEITIGGGKP